MGMNTCNAHGAPSTHRCPICHKPLCSRCDVGGTCSERCRNSREQFGGPMVTVPRSAGFGWVFTVLKVVVLVGLAYGACRHFDVDPIAIVKDLIK